MAVAESATDNTPVKLEEKSAAAISGFPPSPSTIPLEEDWGKALKLKIQDKDGKEYEFGSLVQPDAETDTVLVIFGIGNPPSHPIINNWS